MKWQNQLKALNCLGKVTVALALRGRLRVLCPYTSPASPFTTLPLCHQPCFPPFKSLCISKVLDSLKYLNSTYLSASINSDTWVRKYFVMFLRYRVSKGLYLVRKFLKDVECPVVQGWYKGQKIVSVAEAWKQGIYGDLYCSAWEAVSLWIATNSAISSILAVILLAEGPFRRKIDHDWGSSHYCGCRWPYRIFSLLQALSCSVSHVSEV